MHTSTDVLIVGAGPVGLMLACELQRRGVDHVIIDQRPQPEYYCKALGVTPRTLEVWDQLGVLEDALRFGIFTAGIGGAVNGAETAPETVTLGTMPYGFLMLAQYDSERILRRCLQQHGAQVEQGVALTSFEIGDAGVRARVAGASGAEQMIEARYIVGCDGARSVVRKGLGLEYEGDSYPMTFMLGDVRVHWDRPRPYGQRFTLMEDGALRNVLVCIGVPGDPQRYRLSMAAPPEYWEEDANLSTPPTMEQITEAVTPILPAGATISDLRWSSFYRISHRIVPQYSKGRGFLSGDAAHIHPPIGGQGMNTGLQDAHNLAWKLALDVRGRAAADLLESYSAERQPVGRDVVERTTLRMDDVLDQGEVKFDQWMQDSQLLIHYRASRWVGEDVAAGAMQRGPRPGDQAREVRGLRREWIADPIRLKTLLRGGEHVLFLYFDRRAAPELYARSAAMADALRARCGDDLAIYGIMADGAQPIDHERFPLLSDAGREFRAAYDPSGPCLYLIRPDGHVGYRSDSIGAARLDGYLKRIFVG
jgi:2-polyprenyl-6-methoxyphenol hydroxylase-like FAD-dependent oxidoreductase